MTAKKFYVTDDDRQRAEAIRQEISKRERELWDVLAESYSSGAHIVLGFQTWNAFANNILDPQLYRTIEIGREISGAPRRNDKSRDREILEFIRENPGCTSHDVMAALGAHTTRNVTRLRNTGKIKYEGFKGRSVRIWPNDQEAA